MKWTIRICTLILLTATALPTIAQPYGTGALIDLKAYSQAAAADLSSLGFADGTPTSASVKRYAPLPLDQGQYGTCVGWSSTYAVYTMAFAKAYGINNRAVINAQAFDPYYTYEMSQAKEDPTCVSGVNIYTALNNMRTVGVKRYWLPEFDCQPLIDDRIIEMAKANRIKDFKKLFSYPDDWDYTWESFFATNIDKVSPIKQAIAAGYPVIMSMKLPKSVFGVVGTDLWTPTATEKSDPISQELYGHAMAIVGYDDTKYGGAFEVMNSWGAEFGSNGFFWVKYEDFKQFGAEAYYIEMFDGEATTSGCAMGDCDDSYSRFFFKEGHMYEGELKDGTFHGYGMYVWSNGDMYAGGWLNGKQHGSGVFVAANSTSPIRGFWDNGQYVEYAVSNPAIDKSKSNVGCIEGDCQNGYGVYVESSEGEKYTYSGTWKDGLRHGYGKYELPNGAEYEGQWVNDYISGYGRLKFTDGYTYIGEWKNNKKHGIGVLYNLFGWSAYEFLYDEPITGTTDAASQPVTEGSIRMPKAGTAAAGGCLLGDCTEGKGKISYSDGAVYDGYFKNGKRDGYGVLTFQDGFTVEGHFYKGQIDGIGKVTWPEGSYFIGEFRNGKQDGYGVEIAGSTYYPGIWEFGEYKAGKATLGFAKNELEENVLDFEVKESPRRGAIINRMNSLPIQQIK